MTILVEGYCYRCEGWGVLNPVDTETDEHGVVGLCTACYRALERHVEERGS